MAATRIMTVHPSEELGAAQTVKAVMDYVMNPEKTNGGTLITGFECNIEIAADDFMFMRDEYIFNTGRSQGKNEILVYHIRQSFVPGEITDVDKVNKLGYELALELTGGNHAFIVCTHTDRPHLHNHIIISAVNLDCDRKFRNEFMSYKRVEQISNRITAENNLHVITNPNLSKGTKNRYRAQTKRDGLAVMIDKILTADPPKDFDDLLKRLEKSGCKIRRRGKTISVQPPGAERYFRFKAGKKGLPDGYDEESLRKKIVDIQAGLQNDLRSDFEARMENINGGVHADAERVNSFSSVEDKEIPPTEEIPEAGQAPEPTIKITHDRKINLLIDIENSIKAQNSPGYERWAKGFNLQQAAETLLFLQTNNLTDMEDLTQAADQAQTEYDALQKRIDAADRRIKEVNILQKHIGAYRKNSVMYSQYLRSKRNPQFRKDNEKAIATVEEAKAYFDSLGLDNLPAIKELKAEYTALSQEKNNCYQARNELRKSVFDLQSAKKNVEMLLGIETEPDGKRIKKKGRDDDR